MPGAMPGEVLAEPGEKIDGVVSPGATEETIAGGKAGDRIRAYLGVSVRNAADRTRRVEQKCCCLTGRIGKTGDASTWRSGKFCSHSIIQLDLIITGVGCFIGARERCSITSSISCR